MKLYELEMLYKKWDKSRETLLEWYRETDIEETYGSEGSALHVAAMYGDFEGVDILLERGADVNERNRDYKHTPLMKVAGMKSYYYPPEEAYYQTTVRLLKAGASIYPKNNSGDNCIHMAAQSGNAEFIQAICEAGVRMNMIGRNGENALHMVADYGGRAERSLAIGEGNMLEDRRMFEELKNEQSRYHYEISLKGYEHRVRKDKAYFSICKDLIKAGLDWNEKNDCNETALDKAVIYGAKRIAAFLKGELDENASPEEQALAITAGGMNLFQAIEKCDYDAMRAIIKLGANVNELVEDRENRAGITPLAEAVKRLLPEAVKILIENGADVTAVMGDDRHPMAFLYTVDASIRVNHSTFEKKILPNMIESFYNAGWDINSPVEAGGSPLLLLACKLSGSAGYNSNTLSNTVITTLLKLKAEVNVSNNAGETPLMYASLNDYGRMSDIQLLLLERGADMSRKDKNGNTALMYAAMASNKQTAREMAELLFDFGDPLLNEVNNEGKTALQIATENGSETMVKMLLSK